MYMIDPALLPIVKTCQQPMEDTTLDQKWTKPKQVWTLYQHLPLVSMLQHIKMFLDLAEMSDHKEVLLIVPQINQYVEKGIQELSEDTKV